MNIIVISSLFLSSVIAAGAFFGALKLEAPNFVHLSLLGLAALPMSIIFPSNFFLGNRSLYLFGKTRIIVYRTLHSFGEPTLTWSVSYATT